MKKVFISGSISIKSIPALVKESIERIVAGGMEILIGDADGIDTLVQNFCKGLKYYNVTVYTIYQEPRYAASGFKTKFVDVQTDSKKERERQSEKDIAMTVDSDFCLVVWDGKSRGSYKNILRAIERDKKVKVYIDYENRFLDNDKLSKLEVDFIYRKNNGYTAAELINYLTGEGEDYFKNARELNQFLLVKNVIKKDNNIYVPTQDYAHLFIVEKYKGKVKGIKFTDDFIDWIESLLKALKTPEQTSLF
jgi:hypothetical protein